MAQLPFEIVEHIFSSLERDHLVACSEAHPILSRVAERYLYKCIDIDTEVTTRVGHTLGPSYLINLLSEFPHIVNYVHSLRIYFPRYRGSEAPLEESALILPQLPSLQHIALINRRVWRWQELPQNFRTAVENCLRLPTLKGLHVNQLQFPLSTLNNLMNISCLSVFGSIQKPESADNGYPQLESLAFGRIDNRDLASFTAWVKRRIVKLQSLECDYHEPMVLSLLEICSDTLDHLALDLGCRCTTDYDLRTREIEGIRRMPSIDLSSLRHLQHLTVRTKIYHEDLQDPYFPDGLCITSLPAVVEILQTTSSVQHLTIEISSEIEFSRLRFLPFTVLVESFASFRHVDLYVDSHSDIRFPRYSCAKDGSERFS